MACCNCHECTAAREPRERESTRCPECGGHLVDCYYVCRLVKRRMTASERAEHRAFHRKRLFGIDEEMW